MTAPRNQHWFATLITAVGVIGLTACSGNPAAPNAAGIPTAAPTCLPNSSTRTTLREAATQRLTESPELGFQQITFAFSGTIGGSGSCLFGTGVPPGTELSGRFTFSATTASTASFEPTRVDYFGVSAEVTVGSESIRSNDAARTKVQIHDGPPNGDSYSVIVEGGFDSGVIAGRRIESFVWVVSGGPSLFANTSLPLDPSFLGPRLGSRVCIGDCFNGQTLEGTISDLWVAP